MATAAPGEGQVLQGTTGSAGEAGPDLAGDFHDAVTDASDPFSRASPGGPGGRPDAPPPRMPRPGSRWPEQLAMLAGGLAVITGVSLIRSRQRRRRGWGMVPVRDAAVRLWPAG
jgi:hypothetical protein